MTAPKPTTLTAVATSSGPGRFVRHLTDHPTWDAEGRPVVTPIEVMCGEVLAYAVSNTPRGDGTLLDACPPCPACHADAYLLLLAEVEALRSFQATVRGAAEGAAAMVDADQGSDHLYTAVWGALDTLDAHRRGERR